MAVTMVYMVRGHSSKNPVSWGLEKLQAAFLSDPAGILVCIAGCIAIGLMLSWRYRLGQVRFYDADEMAYLSWGRHVAAGAVPYRDIFYYTTPGFLYVVAAWIGRFPAGMGELDAARALPWAVLVFLSGGVAMLLLSLKRPVVAAVAAVTALVFLPIPSDKILEIRPDTLAMGCTVWAMALQVMWMRRKTSKPILPIASGLLYGCAVFISMKFASSSLLAAFVAVGWSFFRLPAGSFFRRATELIRTLLLFGLAMALLPGSVFAWAAMTGRFDYVWYMLVKFPTETNAVAMQFYIAPGQFFYPSDVYYGIWGYTLGFYLNKIVWMGGMGWAVYRTMTPFLPEGKRGAWGWILVGASLVLSTYLFVNVIPIRHAQYLIPLAVFACIYAGDAAGTVWEWIRTKRGIFSAGYLVLWVAGLFVLWKGFVEVNAVKFYWTNADSKATINHMLSTIPTNTYIYDMVGLAMDYPSPSYAYCLPIGQYAALASRPFTPVAQDLERLKVPYIYQGLLMRTTALLPSDQQYVATHYEALGNGELLIRKGLPHPAGW